MTTVQPDRSPAQPDFGYPADVRHTADVRHPALPDPVVPSPAGTQPGTLYPAWTLADLPPFSIPAPDEPWLRLDPRSIATFPFAQGAPILLALAVTAVAGGHVKGLSIRLGAEVGALVVLGLLRWWRFGYRVVDGRLETRSGLLGRQSKAINVDRIRGVEIEAKLVHRLVGVCALQVEHPGAAGGRRGRNRSGRDHIDAISRVEGARLRAVLLHERATTAHTDVPSMQLPSTSSAQRPSAQRPPLTERTLFRLPTGWLFYAPFSLRMLVVGPVALGGSISYLQDARIDPGSVAASFARGAGWVLALPLALVFVVVLAVGGGAFAYWGWTVTARAEDVVITRGLLTRRTTAIERRRLRGVVLREPLLGRTVHAASLSVELSGVTGASEAGLIPLGPSDALTRFSAEFVPPCSVALQPHPLGALRRRRLRAAVPALLLSATAVVVLFSSASVGIVVSAVAVVAGIAGQLWAQASFRALGHALDDRVLTARHGVLERRTQTVDRRYPIGLRVRQSVFARRAGVASVDVALVSRGHTRISDMAADEVAALTRAVLISAAPGSGHERSGWKPPA